MLRCAILLLALRIVCSAASQSVPVDRLAPDSSNVFRFELKHGAILIGRVVGATDDSIHVAAGAFRRAAIARSDIGRITRFDESSRSFDRPWFPATVPSRHFVGQSAFPMRQGEIRYTNTYFVANALAAGITERVSLSAGIELSSLLDRYSGGPLYFGSVKYASPVADGLHAAACFSLISFPFGSALYASGGREDIGLLGVLATAGSPDRSLTLGLNWSVLSYRWATRAPLITLAGQWRLGRRFSVITENWVLPIPGSPAPYLLGYGLRIMGRRVSADLGLLNNEEIARGIVLGVPFGSFSVKW